MTRSEVGKIGAAARWALVGCPLARRRDQLERRAQERREWKAALGRRTLKTACARMDAPTFQAYLGSKRAVRLLIVSQALERTGFDTFAPDWGWAL